MMARLNADLVNESRFTDKVDLTSPQKVAEPPLWERRLASFNGPRLVWVT
jgi:hypothetical protein